MATYLTADVGGTNSRLFLLRAGKDPNSDAVIAEKTYPSTQFTHLTPIIKKFFSEFVKSSSDMPAVACLAIAGPVKDNHCNITNLGWDLSGEQMAKDLKMSSVLLVNDFVALGYGLLAVDQKDLVPLTKNKIAPKGVKACVGAGTGLGETFLTWNGKDYDCWPAEGGHADFAPRNELEYKLLAYIKNDLQITRVSVERVVSGLGIPYIYSFLRDTAGEDANPEVERRLKTEDKAFVISQYAEKKECPICVRAMEIFIGLYGAEVGNFCLKTLPFGGMYVAGGIAPKSMWAIKENDNFMKNLLAKGRLQSVLENIPVVVVLHKNPGFLGAKVMGRRLLTQAKPRSKL